MKHLYKLAIAAILMAGSTTIALAQQKLTINTISGTDVKKYDQQMVDVTVNRHVFKGWNTISLPFAMTEAKINEVFGPNCRLERLVGVENNGNEIKLNFQDCKKSGIEANVPYILYYDGETANKTISVANAKISAGKAAVTFDDNNGNKVTFAAAKSKVDSNGKYGIMAKDNAEAAFVNVNNVETGFYATRCFITVSSGTAPLLTANHIGADEATGINNVVRRGEAVDVYSVGGTLIGSGMSIDQVSGLNKGIYVIKGKKVMVK